MTPEKKRALWKLVTLRGSVLVLVACLTLVVLGLTGEWFAIGHVMEVIFGSLGEAVSEAVAEVFGHG